MDLRHLLSDDRGVSPVIGVILMVAITVILAAVIGTFVLGLGSNVGNNAPSATFNYEYENFGTDDANHTIEITDQGGDSIEVDTLNVSVGGTTYYSAGDAVNQNNSEPYVSGWESGTISAGDTLSMADGDNGADVEFGNNEDVQIVWQSSGGSSSIISSSTTPQ